MRFIEPRANGSLTQNIATVADIPTRGAPARGFTLVEMVVVTAIVGILLGLALPGMRAFVQSQRLSSAAAGLVYSLNLARSEAIKEDLPLANGGIQVCASTDGATCDPMGNWQNGWIVLSSATATPLQVTGALATGMTLSTAPATPSITFQSTGMLTQLAPALIQFQVCDSRGPNFAREVEVTVTGHIQASQTAGKNVAGVALAVCP